MDVTKREHAFQYLYGEFCNIHNCPILYRVNVFVHMGVLDFYGDGIKENDWRPVLKALSLDRCLRFVAIRSKALPRPFTPLNDSKKSLADPNLQAISRSALVKIPTALRDCLSINNYLSGLELDGLHLTVDSLQILASGLSKSTSLKCLSLRRCLTGDRGCKIICTALRKHPSITFVDFSACDLSDKGALYVSRLLQSQNLNRYNESWIQSLRYRIPNTEVMPGLRRLTLSHNKIGDRGAQYVIEILYDDRWIKAVDLQNCHLTEESGQNILKLFQLNDTISILDVRNNKMMLPNTVAAIILRLTSRRSQFEWHSDDPTCLPRTTSQTTVNLTGLRKADGIRKSVSNIFPSRNLAAKEPRKCLSTPHTSTTQRGSNHFLQKSLLETGSASQVKTLQKHLEQLTQQLEEEVARRKAAEATRDRAQNRLESHLREMAATRAAIDGRVLVDKGVIQQVNSAFCDLNQFLAMIRRAGVGQFLNLPKKPSYQESWGTSYSSEIKCYDDDPTSTEISEARTKNLISIGLEYLPLLAGQGDCLSNGEVNLSSSSKKISERGDDSKTLQNSCTEEERNTKESFSEESDPSWTTMASRSSVHVLGS